MFDSRALALAAFVAAFSFAQLGCGGSDSAPDASTGAYAASGGIPATGDPSMSPSPQPPADVDPSPSTADSPQRGSASAARPPASSEQRKEKPQVELRPLQAGLPPEKLIEFLAASDADMQLIYSGRSGIADPQEARETLLHFVKMKLEASRQLSTHPDADDAAKSEGARGQLQALSHLASLGDLKSAQQLEKLATSSLQSDDPQLAADSRLVLIGFAIESLQHGGQQAAEKIVSHIEQIAVSNTSADMPSLMTMGQARETLVSYGHEAQAQRVRELIIEMFAGSPDPEIARMAAQMAGNVEFDTINKLLGEALRGGSLPAGQWRGAVEQLIDASADLQTVRYLAGSALEFESLERHELADATYEMLAQRFDDPASATAREVQTAMDARQARRDIIGWKFELDLPRTDGSSLNIEDYRGKVVLMPFWAMAAPESLQLVQRLQSIRASNQGQVEIVGVNLDGNEAPLEQFLQQNDLGFPSFRAGPAAGQVAIPVAAQFGIVSMPFAAILDPQGRVAAITLTGRNLEKTVAELVAR